KGKAAEADKNKKTQLDKTEKSKTWADINWTFALSMGPVYPLVNRDNANVKLEPAANAYGMYRLKGNWHVGLFATFSGFRSNTSNSPYETNIEYIASTANLGYYFDLSARWRLTTMVGAGYYLGKYSVSSTCSSANTQCFAPNTVPETQIRNPFALARTGIHFLIFSFLSAGIEGEYRMLYDSKPIHSVGGAASLTLTF
ncbi:MAG TPA: outer membrane beta-barrel protein, partial [Turneriella sp.]|nr:outer membrane beta-barrel protein [Turneriella sp.]